MLECAHGIFRLTTCFVLRTEVVSKNCGKCAKTVPVRMEVEMETTTIETELKAAGTSGRQDLYAGDDAWREWFDVCFVDG